MPLGKTARSFPSAHYLCNGKMMIASAKSDYEKVGNKQPDGITGKADPHTDTRDGTPDRKLVKDGVAGAIDGCLGSRLSQTRYQFLLKGTSPKRYGRLRMDRNSATHREAVIVRPGKGNERKSQRGKWQEPDWFAKRRYALRE